MIPTGPVPVRPLPRRKAPGRGRGWEVLLPTGRWMPEADAIAAGIPLTEPLPTQAPSPVVVRREAPEVPTMPATAPAATPPARGPGAPPSPAQEQAWKAVAERGLYWPDVAREMGTTSWAVKNMIASYMRRNGIPGEPPGRTPKDEATRRTMAAKGQTPKPSEAPVAHVAPEPPHVKADRLVLAPEGHPWAADPEPIETLAAPASDQHLGPETEAPPPAVARVAPSAQSPTIGLVGGGAPPSGGSEPRDTPQGPPVEADGAATTSYSAGDGPPQRGAAGTTGATPGQTVDQPSPAPRTGGGGRDTHAEDFLSRLEHELDRLARTDAQLVEEARRIVEQRTDVARRIEEVRTAGAVFRRVMGA